MATKITHFHTQAQLNRKLVDFLVSKGYIPCDYKGNIGRYKNDITSLGFLKPTSDKRNWFQRLFRLPHRHAFPGTLVGINLKNWTLMIHGNSYVPEMKSLAGEIQEVFQVPVRILIDSQENLFQT